MYRREDLASMPYVAISGEKSNNNMSIVKPRKYNKDGIGYERAAKKRQKESSALINEYYSKNTTLERKIDILDELGLATLPKEKR